MGKVKKVLLITPPYHSGVVESAGVWLNVGFVYIAGSLRAAGYDPVYYDAMSYWHGYDDIQKMIEDEKPDVVATTAFTAGIVDALKVLKLAKDISPRIVTVIGNVHPTFCYEEIFRDHAAYVDYIVRGEGEEALVDLLNTLNAGSDVSKVRSIVYAESGKLVVTPSRAYIKDLDVLPLAWDLVDWPIYTYDNTPDYWGNDSFDDTYKVGDTWQKFEGYCTDVWFREAIKYVEQHRTQPFFLYLTPNAPHGPYYVPDRYAAPYEAAGMPKTLAKFYGMIANIDENLGRFRARLAGLGLAGNTLLIFLTDNGTTAGWIDQQAGFKYFNVGMRGWKGSAFDGGHRVPCFWYWPAGGLSGGREVKAQE